MRKEAATLYMGSYILKALFIFNKEDWNFYGKLDKYLCVCLYYYTPGEFLFWEIQSKIT